MHPFYQFCIGKICKLVSSERVNITVFALTRCISYTPNISHKTGFDFLRTALRLGVRTEREPAGILLDL